MARSKKQRKVENQEEEEMKGEFYQLLTLAGNVAN